MSVSHESLCLYLLLFSFPIESNSLQPHGLQHTRPPCPSPSPGVCPSSCSLHRWCHPAVSSSDAIFSFCPQSFPASETFPVNFLFASDDQNTGASASASVLPVNMQSNEVQGTFRSLLQHHSLKASFLQRSAFFTAQLSQLLLTTG